MRASFWSRALTVLGVIALAFYVGDRLWAVASHFGDVIVTFLLAWIVAFALGPAVTRVQRLAHLGRPLAAVAVYGVLLIVVGGFLVLAVPVALDQLGQLVLRLPDAAVALQDQLGGLQADLDRRGINVALTTHATSVDLASRSAEIGALVLDNALPVAGGVVSLLANGALGLVVSYYLLVDGERLLERLLPRVPRQVRTEYDFLLISIQRTFGGFVRGTLLIAILYAAANAAVMVAFGLSYTLLGSLVAGLAMLIPLFGSVVALGLPLLLALSQGGLPKLLAVGASLLAVQLVLFNAVGPRLMGRSVGVHPLLVFLALLVGVKQAGLVGALFGVPVAGVAVAMVGCCLQRHDGDRASEPGPDG